MDLTPSPVSSDLLRRVTAFVDQEVIPAESTYNEQVRASGHPHVIPPILEELKQRAREAGLWNLFMPFPAWGPGLSNLDYAPLAEQMGRSLIAPEVFNCNAPDTGNMEVLARSASPEQQQRWLIPLLEGRTRSAFAMTEPDVASSDANNVGSTITRDGDEYIVSGRKWFITNSPRDVTEMCLFLGRTDPDAPRHRQHSVAIVPMEAPGVRVERSLSVFGYDLGEGHGEVTFDRVRVPVDNLVGAEGDGFRIAQERLGPGRIHHCMRLLGQAERALTLLVHRATTRSTFGTRIIDNDTIREVIAESRCEIEQARLLTLRTAWLMDTVGAREARAEISMIKIVAPRAALNVIDRAIQVHGATGVSQDTPLAHHFAHARTMRIVDGPDAVHLRTIARQEIHSQLQGA